MFFEQPSLLDLTCVQYLLYRDWQCLLGLHLDLDGVFLAASRSESESESERWKNFLLFVS